jgi:NAD(P)-dependent dehydrogenase (short-subunit alcohol dehydrogenase family)
MVDEVAEHLGHIDILVNSARCVPPRHPARPDRTPGVFDQRVACDQFDTGHHVDHALGRS